MVHGTWGSLCMVHGALCMVHGTWYMVQLQCAVRYGAWCMVFDSIRCMVHGAVAMCSSLWCYGAWYMVQLPCAVRYGAWCTVHGAWCVVHGAWCMVHGAWCMVHGACMVHVCRMHGAWCSCNVQFAMHTPSIAHMRQSMGTLFMYLCHLGIEMCVYDTCIHTHSSQRVGTHKQVHAMSWCMCM